MHLSQIKQNWDLIIIGGGITGAGIFLEAGRMGLSALLVEQRDFAWGTSSRSSKLVHGGLRYLKEGHFGLTRTSVEERQRLLREAPGLVDPLGFLVPVYQGKNLGKWTLEVGLSIYDMIGGARKHRYFEAEEFLMRAPNIRQDGLTGGFHFFDAQTDDARLVLRVIHEGETSGGTALNYTAAKELVRSPSGRIRGIIAQDAETGDEKRLAAPAVINATGTWAEALHASPEKDVHIRPLRGSHLVFPRWSLPLAEGVSFTHPEDDRAMFAVPWENCVLVGTTDLDHEDDLAREPAISLTEAQYLLEGVRYLFPSQDCSLQDCISTLAGVRPVLSRGRGKDPSEESREHAVWIDRGLVTITGGKLTTFRRLAWDALDAVIPFLPGTWRPDRGAPVFSDKSDPPENLRGLSAAQWQTLFGRYGKDAGNILRQADDKNLHEIPETRNLWAELPYAAGENIRHLDDLMLRRLRLGLLTPGGGMMHLPKIRKLCEPVLGWNDARWESEINRYRGIWQQAHAVPTGNDASSRPRESGPPTM